MKDIFFFLMEKIYLVKKNGASDKIIYDTF